ncbi:MAG: trigger factor [Candidatus Latescibacteria bacterium]|jgi:trigger factor|nr:trigger factor [Candidatus Latescibacterota bacterium]
MKVQVSESGGWRRTLEVEVPCADVEKRLEAAYRSYGKTLKIPGFRKGKVPAKLVKAQFGEAIRGEVLQELMQEFYREASDAEDLHPISQATIEEMDYDEGQPLKFKASVDVKPEIQVQGYKGLQVTRPVFKVEESHIDEQVALLQDQSATEEAVDRPAELGDVLLVDLQELDESGVPLVGRRQEDRPLQIGGPSTLNHDLDNQLVGISAGESRRVQLAHQEDDSDPERAGKEVYFQVDAKEIRERKLPELDDEFAKDMGEFESFTDLKARIGEDLQTRSDRATRRRLEENIIDGLIRENSFEVPDSMVENYLDAMIEGMRKEHQGHDHDIDEEAVRTEGRDTALRSVKRYLLLEAVAEQEGIEVTDEDRSKRIETISEHSKIEVERLRQALQTSGQLGRMNSELLEEKTMDLLVEVAKVEDVEEVTES